MSLLTWQHRAYSLVSRSAYLVQGEDDWVLWGGAEILRCWRDWEIVVGELALFPAVGDNRACLLLTPPFRLEERMCPGEDSLLPIMLIPTQEPKSLVCRPSQTEFGGVAIFCNVDELSLSLSMKSGNLRRFHFWKARLTRSPQIHLTAHSYQF